MRILKKMFVISTLALLTQSAYAATPTQHTIVAPACLVKKLNADYTLLASAKNLQLIQMSENQIEKLMTAKNDKKSLCGGFMDVSHAWQNKLTRTSSVDFLSHYTNTPKSLTTKNYQIHYSDQVTEILKNYNPQHLWTRLQALTSYPNRMAFSEQGAKVAKDIKAQVEEMARANGRHDVTSYFVQTKGFNQPSVVVKIGTSNEPGILIGAHMDTFSRSMMDPQPGADDDGSGTVTVLSVANTLLSSGMTFKKPIYLTWYAAEELGLIGSQHVVADFKAKHIPISEVMQLDMTGYDSKENNHTMWIYDDYTNPALNSYLETLIDTYVKAPIGHSQCGYACSDHASWTQEGYAAVMPFEAAFNRDNPDIHSAYDTIDKLSLEHMHQFAKLAIAFAIELAEPIA